MKRVEGPMRAYPENDGWLIVRKRPVLVHAKEMHEPFTTQTLEGEVKNGKPSDYLMVGVEGEVYPIRRDIFLKTYAVLGTERGLPHVPFHADFRSQLADGSKRATTRTKPYGEPGHRFESFGMEFEWERTEWTTLVDVAEHHYGEEGFLTAAGFAARWQELHPRVGYDATQKVWFGTFHRVDNLPHEHVFKQTDDPVWARCDCGASEYNGP